MSLDIELAAYNAVAAVKNAAQVTALPAAQKPREGAWIFQTADAMRTRRAAASLPAFYPQVILEARAFTQQLPSAPRTFVMNKTTYTPSQCDAQVPLSGQLLLTIVHEQSALTTQTPLEAAIRAFLTSIWPTMGLQYIRGFSVQGQRRDENSALTNNAPRTVVRCGITYSGFAKLSQLVA